MCDRGQLLPLITLYVPLVFANGTGIASTVTVALNFVCSLFSLLFSSGAFGPSYVSGNLADSGTIR